MAEALPDLTFQPTDPSAEARASIDDWCAALSNVRQAWSLDAVDHWLPHPVDAVLCINMIHIAPWAATVGLICNAGCVLRAGAPLLLYGPFSRQDEHLAPSNAEFDASLRARNPEWGIRTLEVVAGLAIESGFGTPEIIPMPANNLLVAFRSSGSVR